MTQKDLLLELYKACCQTQPFLLPIRIREAMLRCAIQTEDTPQDKEDGTTAEELLHRSASTIQGLLENVGFFDNDGCQWALKRGQ